MVSEAKEHTTKHAKKISSEFFLKCILDESMFTLVLEFVLILFD